MVDRVPVRQAGVGLNRGKGSVAYETDISLKEKIKPRLKHSSHFAENPKIPLTPHLPLSDGNITIDFVSISLEHNNNFLK